MKANNRTTAQLKGWTTEVLNRTEQIKKKQKQRERFWAHKFIIHTLCAKIFLVKNHSCDIAFLEENFVSLSVKILYLVIVPWETKVGQNSQED